MSNRISRTVQSITDRFGTSGVAIIVLLLAMFGWFLTIALWGAMEIVRGHADPSPIPAYLPWIGMCLFTAVAIASGGLRMLRKR